MLPGGFAILIHTADRQIITGVIAAISTTSHHAATCDVNLFRLKKSDKILGMRIAASNAVFATRVRPIGLVHHLASFV